MFHEPRNSFQLWMSKRVGVTGLEPATLWSQTRCATNCATPRLYYHAISRPLKRYRLSPRLSCVCAIFLSFFLNLSQVFFFDCLNSSGYSFKLYITNFLQIYLVFPKQSNKKGSFFEGCCSGSHRFERSPYILPGRLCIQYYNKNYLCGGDRNRTCTVGVTGVKVDCCSLPIRKTFLRCATITPRHHLWGRIDSNYRHTV